MDLTARVTLIAYDVGHGDHLLLRVEDGDRRFHAVIDCHWARPTPPPALAQLVEWGVTTLDLLVLSHPHEDHVLGLAPIAEHFRAEGRRLVRFADPGLDLRGLARTFKPGRLRDELLRLHAATVGARRASGSPAYQALSAPLGPVPATARATLHVVAPAFEHTQAEHDRLGRGERVRPNRVSSVLLWRLVDAAVLLGGDLEHAGWAAALERCRAAGIDLSVDVVKVGHHGARNALAPGLLEAIRRKAPRVTHAVLSTPGTVHHPSRVTLEALVEAGVRPRCTELGPVCEPLVPAGRRSAALASLGAVPDEPRRRTEAVASTGAREVVDDRRCFGDVRVEVSGAGEVRVVPGRAGARCRLFETRRSTDDDGVV